MYIGCCFNNYGKMYTYQTHIDFEVGDVALVRTGTDLKLVNVMQIDLPTPQNTDINYKHVVGKVFMNNVGNSATPEDDFGYDSLDDSERSYGD